MGMVTTNRGTHVDLTEIDGIKTLAGLYSDIQCEIYTDTYRSKCINACAKLGREAWGILHVLHEISNSSSSTILLSAAKDAIKKIDPGRPEIRKDETSKKSNRLETTFPVQTNNGYIHKKPEIKKVVLTDISSGDISEGTRVHGTCAFCDKNAIFPKSLITCCNHLAIMDKDGNKRLYCNFCLRNEFYRQKHQKNILIMSLRGIIGYYYYCFHMVPKTAAMWLPEIKEYIDLHVRMGIQNPLFKYDSETFCWFIDFSKVGTRKRQMPLDSVLKTTVNLLSAFNLYENVKEGSPATLFNKYREAIVDFHNHRRRPEGRKILSPTLFGCGIPMETSLNKAIPNHLLTGFKSDDLAENYRPKKNNGNYDGHY